MEATHSDPGYETWLFPDHPFFRLQCAILCLVDVLLDESGQHNVLTDNCGDATAFATNLCNLASWPPVPDIDSYGKESHMFARDKIFVSILLKLVGNDLDGWINDPQNDVFVRHWIYVIQRCGEQAHSDPGLHVTYLLKSRAVRELNIENWGKMRPLKIL